MLFLLREEGHVEVDVLTTPSFFFRITFLIINLLLTWHFTGTSKLLSSKKREA